MYITDASTVVIEVTRRCNMCCAHCLRGDAQNVDIMPEYIDKSFEKFRPGTSISSITFTGGEITLNLAAIWYTLEVVKRRNISVYDFYMVTNGKDASKMPEPASVSQAWWVYCRQGSAAISRLLAFFRGPHHQKGPLRLKLPRFHQWTNLFCSYPLFIAVQGLK